MTDERAPHSWTDRFWLLDYQPVDGKLRATVYLGLLWLSFFDLKSPIRGIALYEATDPGWYSAVGLAGWVGLPWLDPTILQTLIPALVGVWLCAAAGLWFRVTSVATAVGVVFLHALFAPTSALNHAWYITMYTLVALCWSRDVDGFSLDARLGRKPLAPMTSLVTSGFCRKLVLVAVVAFYFSAGISKLRYGGFAWLDGRSLQHAIQRKDEVGPIGPWLAEHPALCSAASVLSFALELGAPLALWRPARLFMVLGWVGMHLGIIAVLHVFYQPNCWCMILLIDWQALAARWRKARTSRARLRYTPSRWLGVAWTVPLVGALVAVLHVEWWPLTAVDMYSAYNTAQWKAGHPWWHFRRMPQIQEMARQCRARGCARHAREFIGDRARYRLVGAAGHRDMRVGPGSHSRKHWVRMVMTPVVVDAIATQPDGVLGAPAPEGVGHRFLARSLPILRRHVHDWDTFDSVQLVYPLDERDVVLASVPLR